MTLTTRPKPRPATHDKKRSGHHHKKSKQYTKAYWPYLPMLMIVVIGLAINVLWTARPAALGYQTSFSENTLLNATNSERTNSHMAGLTLNPQLSAAAQAKAADMITRDYWSHTTPDGAAPWSFVQTTGYRYTLVGENLAYGFTDVDSVIDGWMHSPEHRANVLNSNYSEVGFGLVQASNFIGTGQQVVVVAMYGEPASNANVANLQAVVPEQTQLATMTEPDSKPIARLQLLTGQAQWPLYILVSLAVIALVSVIIRHIRYWRHYLLEGELLIMHHPKLDAISLSLAMLGLILSRAVGFIR